MKTRAARKLLRQWNLLSCPTLSEIISTVSARLQKPIRIVELPPDVEISGCMIPTSQTVTIAWNPTLCLSPTHREHIILHEIAHIVLDPASIMTTRTDAPEDLRIAYRSMHESVYDDETEHAAETLACLLSANIEAAQSPLATRLIDYVGH